MIPSALALALVASTSFLGSQVRPEQTNVKEIPDRGERQEALPVKDDSLVRPSENR